MAPATMSPVTLRLGDRELLVSHPDKLLWPDMGIDKLRYVRTLAELAPYLLPHSEGRHLTTIRFPEGYAGKSFYQKNAPTPVPEFVRTETEGGIRYVVLDSLPTLLWMGSLYALEFHVSCERIGMPLPDRWMLDIDPSLEVEPRIMEAADKVGDLLHSLGLEAVPKTSGATGIQVVMRIEPGPTYDDLRRFGKFVSDYLTAKNPRLFTVERLKKNRGSLIYLDYLQYYPGRTLVAAYSPRARAGAPVSTPLDWSEVRADPSPADFNLTNIAERLRKRGDLIGSMKPQRLGDVLKQIKPN
ncbi:non-homologous end-joining DNA ligase [Cohnella ginsengisoli]|uniref:Non-homologous end-joining DNA ligase n=1 Tax=Cohnella ginsengisoli TaxID=425004 RepID=A0A9X4QLX9_9BACL|nr:non-homologous end-joining DNA ligase [Cohnella ginsengisoli]MDG0790761.1 non-homologous end-joining DNA ligase [Cohnella ginsengisoli]